jgi:type IV secretion system protein VirB5
MKPRLISAIAVVLLATVGFTRPARAQWVVVDPTSLTQLLIQVQQITQEITLAEKTLSQAQQAYNSTTGNRGMQNLISGTNRNYLPANWTQLTGAMSGGGGTYGALGSDITATVSRNAVLTPAQTSQLSASELDSLTQRRQSVALLEALARAALSTNSARFSSLQGLIGAIPTANDQKGMLELHARVGAEQTMLQTEHAKLDTLYKAAQVAADTERERADEKAIAGIGHVNQLPPMGLGSN